MGRYPKAEGRESTEITNPHSVVVDLESYRRHRARARSDTNADLAPFGEGANGTDALDAPVEGNHQD